LERLKEIINLIKSHPVEAIKYLIVSAGIFVVFSSFFEAVAENKPKEYYFLYVGVLGVCVFLVAIIKHNAALCAVLSLTGLLAIIDNPDPDTINGWFIGLYISMAIAKHYVWTILTYFTTALAVTANVMIHDKTPVDALNIMVAIFLVYAILDILRFIKHE
jgi:hypothetical protein